MSARKDRNLLTDKFDKFQSLLPPVEGREVALYEKHYSLLREWNEKIALVSRKSFEFCFENHYADSVQISHFAKQYLKEGMQVYDLGSGAGFPGLLFGIRYPAVKVVLHERIQKKRNFLDLVRKELGLANVEVQGELKPGSLKGLFLGRAVMPKEELFPYMLKVMTSSSILVANAGGLEALGEQKGYVLLNQQKYSLPLEAGSRHVAAFKKV